MKVIVTAGEQAWGWTLNTSGGPHFVDVPPDHTFYVYIETAYNRGLISGYAGGYFYPGNNAARAGRQGRLHRNGLHLLTRSDRDEDEPAGRRGGSFFFPFQRVNFGLWFR